MALAGGSARTDFFPPL